VNINFVKFEFIMKDCWGPVNVYRGCSTETLTNFGFLE